MLWSIEIILLLGVINLCSGNNGLQKPGRSLVIIFDVTSSMASAIEELRKGVQILMENFVSRQNNPIENYILVQFRDDELDPDLIPIFISSNYTTVEEKLQTLQINDGINGDCAESSYNGIRRGLEAANDNPICFIVTDAGTKNHELLPEIHRLMAKKHAQLNFFISSGGCDNQTFLDHYQNLAFKSNGLLFEVDPENILEIFRAYRLLINNDSIITDAVEGDEGNTTYEIVIENSMKQFTFTLAGDNSKIEVYDPNSKLVLDRKDLLDMENAKIFRIENPIPGIWILKFQTDSSFTGQLSVKSELQFKYGFSIIEPNSISEVNPYPLKGQNTFLAIHPTTSTYQIDLEYVMLVSGNSTIKQNLQKIGTPDGDIFLTKSFEVPTEQFKIVLHGKNFKRLLSTTIGPNPIEKPDVEIVSEISVHEGEPIYLICRVTSAVNVTMNWAKIGDNSQLKSVASGNVLNYTIDKAEMFHAGKYNCVATNSEGDTASTSNVLVIPIPLNVTTEQNSITIDTGEQLVELKCVVLPNFPSVKSFWLFNQMTDLPQGSVLNGANLILRDINPKFNGTYTCVGVKDGDEKRANVQLHVQYPPKILDIFNSATNTSIDTSQPIRIYDQSQLNIFCLSEGNPISSVTWIRNKVHRVSSTAALNINGNDPSQSGDYSCQVESGLGKDEQEISVEIVVAPKLLPSSSQTHNVKLGDSFKLECPLKVIPHNNINITWYHNGTILNEDSYLTWPDVNHNTNGEYKCIAKNRAGKVELSSFINVIYEPSILIITKTDDLGMLVLGPNVFELDVFNTTTLSLTCNANGNPEPTISWIKDSKVISTGKTVTINDTNFGFSGLIKCSAQNEVNTISRIISLKEIKKPKMRLSYQNIYNLTENRPFSVSCPVESGEYVVTWTLNGNSLDKFKQSDNSILINSVEQTDMKGNAVCVATNKAGAVHANLTFDVLRAPFNLSGTANNKTTLMENKTLEITCTAHGNPTPNIYWIKDNQLHSNNSSISFTSVHSKDTANYTCIAINSLGNRSATFEVIVDFPPRILNTSDLFWISTNQNITILKLDTFPNVTVEYYKANYKKLIQFNAGDDILLDCPINGHPVPNIKWFKNNNIVSWSNDTLRIDNIATSDSAIYKCVGANAHGNMEIVFFLNDHSQIVDSTNLIEIFDQSTYHLLCFYAGISSKIVWFSHNSMVASNTSILMINGGDTSYSGDYYCQIDTDSGEKKQMINVDITVNTEPLDSYDKEVEAHLGRPLELICPFKMTPNQKWNITWYHNGTLINKNAGLINNKLKLPVITYKDNGMYKCRVENKAGPFEIVLNVNVVFEPSIVSLERIDDSGILVIHPNLNLVEIYNVSSIKLVCNVNGNPVPNTIWKKNGLEISTTSELNIGSLTVESSHHYQCFTQNKLDSAERNLTINVIVKPNVLLNYPKSMNLTENLPFELECPIKKGDFNVKWYLNETNIDSFQQPNQLIKFKAVTPNLTGEATCIATNKAGSATAAFKFVVLRAPHDIVTTTNFNQILKVSSNLYTMTLNTTELLDLTCKANGNPIPQIIWYKDNQRLSTGNSISIASVTPNDHGNYKCIAINHLGSKSEMFQITIFAPPQLLEEANLKRQNDIATISMLDSYVDVTKEFFAADYQKFIEYDIGNQINLNCQMNGNPVPKISWFKNDIPNNETSQILILPRTSDVAGIYKCIGTNHLGSTRMLFYVNKAANKLNSSIQPIEIYDKTIKYILCAYSGKTTEVQWVKQYGILIYKTPVLTINGGSVEQTGEYICQMGTRQQKILVEVTITPELHLTYPLEHRINLGEPFTLNCPLVAIPGNKYEIKWHHNNTEVQKHFNQSDSLSFASVGHGENGIYKCIAQNKAGSIDATIKLDVVYGPNILKIERSDDLGSSVLDPNDQILEIYNSNDFYLTCHTTGNPAPTAIWKKDGIEISPTAIIKIKVETQFFGDYECFAKNTLGSIIKSIKLKKIVRPIVRTSYSKEVELVLKTPFSMGCPIESGEYNVSWSLNGKNIDKFKLANQTIYIDSVKSNMKGDVECTATNKAGTDYAVFEFNISGPPFKIDIEPLTTVGTERGIYRYLKKLYVNESFDLICKAEGNPPPTFLWLHNTNFHDVKETLQFKSVQLNNSGDYLCTASNEYGSLNKTYTIKVITPVNIERTSLKEATNINEIRLFGITALSHIRVPSEYFIATYQEYVKINEKENFVLDCKMSGHPTIKWFKNNEPLDKINAQTITYTNAIVQDSGIYKCADFSNNLQILFYVIVKKKFSIELFASSKPMYRAGETISIYCKAKGNPVPQLTLNGPGVKLNSGNTIKNIINGKADFQEQNGTFYTINNTVSKPKDLKNQSRYNIITYEFEDGQYIATYNHIIKSAKNDHRGIYTCTIRDYKSNSTNKNMSKINITIEAPPYIDENLAATLVYYITDRGDKINCPIKGLPSPIVDWFNNGTKMIKSGPFAPKKDLLYIKNPTMANTGSYSCKHVNSSLEFNFKIQIIRRKINLNKDNFKKTKNIVIKKGDTIQLNCTCSGRNIFWNEIVNKNNKMTAYHIANNPVHTIVGDVSGTLMCTDQMTPTRGELFNITVLDKPKIVSKMATLEIKLGTNFSLNCKVIGNPEPKIMWYKKIADKWENISKVLDFQQTSPTILTKSNALTIDNAQYKCVAENEYGQDSKNFTVNVLDESNYFSSWGKWSECSKTCGNGTQKRFRKCIHPSCNFVVDSEVQICLILDCPIHGGWSKLNYTKCSLTCLRFNTEKSEMTAIRKCNNPKPSLGGKTCRGMAWIRRTCYVPYCDSDVTSLSYANCPERYECCPDTFQYNNRTRSCEEINPCDRKGRNSVCNVETQICTNTGFGQFRCECKPGFTKRTKKESKFRCYDFNECLQNPNPCGNKTCINIIGSFHCL